MSEISVESPPKSNPVPVPSGSWRTLITTVSVFSLVVLGVVAGCGEEAPPKESVESLRNRSSTLQATADRQGQLRIAVWEDVPYMYFRDPTTGERSGFEIEIAKALGKELGYSEDRIDWVTIDNLPDRLSILGEGRADMVVASFSMTEEREKAVDFAGPYMLVPQAVMVRSDRVKRIESIGDLRSSDVRVCTANGSTSEQTLANKGINTDLAETNAKCMAGLRKGDYDAFSTDLPILAGFKRADDAASGQERFEILDLTIADTSEKIGVAVPEGDQALRKLVAHFLHQWQTGPEAASPWVRAYDDTIGKVLPPRYRSQPLVTNPPDLADYNSKAPQA